jgi:hypothetical protein
VYVVFLLSVLLAGFAAWITARRALADRGHGARPLAS